MKRILLSIASILLVGTMTVLAGMSGKEGMGETLATGVIDLRVNNESYVTNNEGKLIFSSSTSWKAKNLTNELFFDFGDVKPGDYGEDTISLHTNKEKAWGCMKVKLTETDGELQEGLYFAFWADDGDNVFEVDEKIFKEGKASEIFNDKWWTLADSETNIWQKEGWNYYYKYTQKWDQKYSCKPIPEQGVKYIGKIWCFGELTPNPLSQDGQGKSKSNGPLVRGTGWRCEGQDVGNEYQRDSISLDVSFLAMQHKVNEKFVCGEDSINYSTFPKPKKFRFPFWFWAKFNSQ